MTWKVSSKSDIENESFCFEKKLSKYTKAKNWLGKKFQRRETSESLPLKDLDYRLSEQKTIKRTYSLKNESNVLPHSRQIFKRTLSSPSTSFIKPTNITSSNNYYESLQQLGSDSDIKAELFIGCHNLRLQTEAACRSFEQEAKLQIIVSPKNKSKPAEGFNLFYRHPWIEGKIAIKDCSSTEPLRVKVEELKEEIRANALYRMGRVSAPPIISKLWQPLDPKQQASLKSLYKLFDKMDVDHIDQANVEKESYSASDLKNKLKEKLKLIRDGKHNKKLKECDREYYQQLYKMLRLISWYLQQPEHKANRTHILTNLALGSCRCSTRFKEEVMWAYRELTDKVHTPDLLPLEDLFAQWSIDYKEGLLDLTVAKMKGQETGHIRFGIAMELSDENNIHTNTVDFTQCEELPSSLFQGSVKEGYDSFLSEYHPYHFATYCQERLDDLFNSSRDADHYKAYLLNILIESVEPYMESNQSSDNSQHLASAGQYLTDQELIIEDLEIGALKTTSRKGMYHLLTHFQLLAKNS